jgi:hypothetical protein
MREEMIFHGSFVTIGDQGRTCSRSGNSGHKKESHDEASCRQKVKNEDDPKEMKKDCGRSSPFSLSDADLLCGRR